MSSQNMNTISFKRALTALLNHHRYGKMNTICRGKNAPLSHGQHPLSKGHDPPRSPDDHNFFLCRLLIAAFSPHQRCASSRWPQLLHNSQTKDARSGRDLVFRNIETCSTRNYRQRNLAPFQRTTSASCTHYVYQEFELDIELLQRITVASMNTIRS